MSNPKVGLTSFIDYFAAQSPTKIAKVRAAKRMMTGDGFDHWQLLRQAAVSSLVAGGDKGVIRTCVASASAKRTDSYKECGDCLVRWLGRKKISATALPQGKVWSSGGLDVSVNPEVRVSIDSGPKLNLKLYFKADQLSKRAADPMLRLIEQEFGQGSGAILDVRRRRLFTGPLSSPADLDLLLRAEASSFATIWAGI